MVSRQRKWQLKQQILGNCMICGKRAVTKKYCEEHRRKTNSSWRTPKHRKYRRNYMRIYRAQKRNIEIDLKKFIEEKEAIVPIIGGEGIYYSRRFSVNTADGWYKVKLGNRVEIIEKADDLELQELLDTLPQIKGYAIADSIVPLNFQAVKFKYGYTETTGVYFINADLWDVIKVARWEDGKLFYGGVDFGCDTTVVEAVKNRFEKEEDLEGVKGVTPELRYLYLLLCLQRDNFRQMQELEKLKLSEVEREKRLREFRETLAGRLMKTVTDAGGALVSFQERGTDSVMVKWKVGGQIFNSLVRTDLRILDLGYCASGADRQHTLSSAINLAKIFQEQHTIHVTRE